MKTQIKKIMNPKLLMIMLFEINRVAYEWKLGSSWKREEPTLVRRSEWDIIHQNALAKIHLNRNIN